MVLARIMQIVGMLVMGGAAIFLVMSFLSYDPSAIYYIVASLVVLVIGLLTFGVGYLIKKIEYLTK